MSVESDTATRKRFTDYLACDDHNNRTAEQVCGECGQPVCKECASTVSDITLRHYEGGGLGKVVVGLALLVGVPTLLNVIAPQLIGDIVRLVFDKPLYLKGGIVLSAVYIGLAYLALVRYRTRYGLSDVSPLELDDVVQDFELLVRRSGSRTVCEDCKRDKQVQRYLLYGVTLAALAFVLVGLYLSFSKLYFAPLKYTGSGVALYIVRKDLVALVVSTDVGG